MVDYRERETCDNPSHELNNQLSFPCLIEELLIVDCMASHRDINLEEKMSLIKDIKCSRTYV